MNRPTAPSGYALIEVLVTMIIIAVGLLGLAALQSRALQAEMESYQRAQALILANDMVNRINANRSAAPCYELGATTIGSGFTGAFACTAWGVMATQAIATSDLAAWNQMLLGAAESLDGTFAGAMIGARGCITVDPATGAYTVSVAWQGLAPTVEPANTCGQGSYADKTRRVVSTTFRIPNLSAPPL